jgi:predicted Co/Zn/Cd cation transporter (cation efflux family)
LSLVISFSFLLALIIRYSIEVSSYTGSSADAVMDYIDILIAFICILVIGAPKKMIASASDKIGDPIFEKFILRGGKVKTLDAI